MYFSKKPKSAEQREKVKKASTEGIAIQGQQGARLLPEQLLTEAFILSDLFDMGELAALELLLAGEKKTKTHTHTVEVSNKYAQQAVSPKQSQNVTLGTSE